MRINENKKIICFNSPDVKLFTEMLNDLRFPILNEICNNEPLEKKEIYLRIQEKIMNGYIEENINNFVKAYENLLKTRYIEINSDNKIEPTEYGKIFIDLYYERQKFLAYQYNPETKEDVLVESLFEYRYGKRIIPTEQELMNIYVLFRGNYESGQNFLNSAGDPCSLRDATLFSDYNKAYEFLRECYKNNPSIDVHVFSIYELNTATEHFGTRKFEDGFKLVNKNAFLTVLNGHLVTYKDAKKFIL